MAVYFVKLGQSEYKVEIFSNRFLVNGRRLDMKLQQLNEQGLYLIERGKQKLEMLVRPDTDESMFVSVNNRQLNVQVEREGAKSNAIKGKLPENEFVAPLPGVVVAVHVEKGAQIEKGDALLTLESMKMQMDIRATASGVVQDVTKQVGDRVEKGEILARLKV